MKSFLLVVLAFIAFDFLGYAQLNDLENSRRYIKIVVDTAVSLEQQQQITAALNQITGIETARMDHVTSVFLGVYTPSITVSEHTFLNWFTNHGYPIRCYYDAVYTPGGMINLSKTSCP